MYLKSRDPAWMSVGLSTRAWNSAAFARESLAGSPFHNQLPTPPFVRMKSARWVGKACIKATTSNRFDLPDAFGPISTFSGLRSSERSRNDKICFRCNDYSIRFLRRGRCTVASPCVQRVLQFNHTDGVLDNAASSSREK